MKNSTGRETRSTGPATLSEKMEDQMMMMMMIQRR